MARSQLVRLAAAHALAVPANPAIGGFNLAVVPKSGGDIGFTVTSLDNNFGQRIQVCDDKGEVRVFANADDFVKAAVKVGLLNSTSAAQIFFQNIAAIEAKPFTGDYTAKYKATRAAHVVSKGKQDLLVTKLTANLALMPSVTAAQVAYKAQKTEARDEAQALSDWYTAEIAAITAIVGA